MSSSSTSDSPVYPRQRKDYELRSRGSIAPRKEISCTAMTKYSGKPSHELGHVPIASTSKISDPRAMLSLKRSNEARNMHFDKGVKSRAFICAQAAAIVHSGSFQKSIEEDCELISNSSSNKENKPPKRKINSKSKPKNRLEGCPCFWPLKRRAKSCVPKMYFGNSLFRWLACEIKR